MKTLIVGLLAALSMLGASSAEAASIKLGSLGYGGTGCPAGTASVSASGTAISVKFKSYNVAAGGSTGKSFDREACSLAIPISVPKGQAVAIVGMDFTGYANIPSGASVTFTLEQFLVGGQGPKVNKTVTGPIKGKFTASTNAALTWSACGASTILRTNSSLLVKASGSKAASASIRSQDVGATIVYQLKFKSC